MGGGANSCGDYFRLHDGSFARCKPRGKWPLELAPIVT